MTNMIAMGRIHPPGVLDGRKAMWMSNGGQRRTERMKGTHSCIHVTKGRIQFVIFVWYARNKVSRTEMRTANVIVTAIPIPKPHVR